MREEEIVVFQEVVRVGATVTPLVVAKPSFGSQTCSVETSIMETVSKEDRNTIYIDKKTFKNPMVKDTYTCWKPVGWETYQGPNVDGMFYLDQTVVPVGNSTTITIPKMFLLKNSYIDM